MESSIILKNIAKEFHNNDNKYKIHNKLNNYILNLSTDRNFLINSLKNCISRRNFFLNDAQNLFFYLLIEGDVIVAINLFPPTKNKEINITHDNIHHHGWRLLSTALVIGEGYETINFKRKSHEIIQNNVVKLKIEDSFKHVSGEVKFIDSEQAHVVFQPQSTSATLAVWSSDRSLRNQKLKKIFSNFPYVNKFISNTIHKLNLNNFFGLNKKEGVYFHPENEKIVITKNYSKPIDGERKEITHCMFKFFQDIEFKDMDFFHSLKNSIPIESHDVCEKLISNEKIEDLGIIGNPRRRFTKKQILNAIDDK